MENYWPSLVDSLIIVGILLGPLIWFVTPARKRKQPTVETEGDDVRKTAIVKKARIRFKPIVAGFIIMFTVLSIIYLLA